MAAKGTHSPAADARANDLYWNSGLKIDDIVAEIGMSRNSLYGSVTPLKVGVHCPTCGGDLVFTTRTNRASGTATCGSCGLPTRIAEDDLISSPVTKTSRANGKGKTGKRGRWRAKLAAVAPDRAAMIGGAAALGAVIGAAAARAIRD